MQPQTKWQKIVSYTPVAVAIQSLSALFIVFFFFKPHRSDWMKVIVFCLFYGVISTIAIKAYAEKYIKSLGLSTREQSMTLAAAFKKGEVPRDKKLRDAMPAALDQRLKTVRRQQRWMPFNTIVLGLALLFSAIGRHWPSTLLFCFMTGLSIYSYFSLNKSESKLLALKAKLEVGNTKVGSDYGTEKHESQRKNRWQIPN